MPRDQYVRVARISRVLTTGGLRQNQLLQKLSKSVKSPYNDSWILRPMLQSSHDSFTGCNAIIHECEEGLFTLSP